MRVSNFFRPCAWNENGARGPVGYQPTRRETNVSRCDQNMFHLGQWACLTLSDSRPHDSKRIEGRISPRFKIVARESARGVQSWASFAFCICLRQSKIKTPRAPKGPGNASGLATLANVVGHWPNNAKFCNMPRAPSRNLSSLDRMSCIARRNCDLARCCTKRPYHARMARRAQLHLTRYLRTLRARLRLWWPHLWWPRAARAKGSS